MLKYEVQIATPVTSYVSIHTPESLTELVKRCADRHQVILRITPIWPGSTPEVENPEMTWMLERYPDCNIVTT